LVVSKKFTSYIFVIFRSNHHITVCLITQDHIAMNICITAFWHAQRLEICNLNFVVCIDVFWYATRFSFLLRGERHSLVTCCHTWIFIVLRGLEL